MALLKKMFLFLMLPKWRVSVREFFVPAGGTGSYDVYVFYIKC